MTVTGLTPGALYYFAVRAQDAASNLGDISNSSSAPAAAPAPVGASTYDDGNAAWYYAGAWTASSGVTGPLNGTRHYTT